MLILALRTDKPKAVLYLLNDSEYMHEKKWNAHRQLATTLHKEIEEILLSVGKDWAALAGIAVFGGPGSFTGLRIGVSVANSLGSGLEIPVVSAYGDDWLNQAVKKLLDSKDEKPIIPKYGQPAFTTSQKK